MNEIKSGIPCSVENITVVVGNSPLNLDESPFRRYLEPQFVVPTMDQHLRIFRNVRMAWATLSSCWCNLPGIFRDRALLFRKLDNVSDGLTCDYLVYHLAKFIPDADPAASGITLLQKIVTSQKTNTSFFFVMGGGIEVPGPCAGPVCMRRGERSVLSSWIECGQL